MQRSLIAVLLTSLFAVACGDPGLRFIPSNLPADAPLGANGDIVFNGEQCGTRAEIDSDRGEIRCFASGQTNPKFTYTVKKDALQGDGTEVALFVGHNVRIENNFELQLRGDRPVVLVALGTMVIRGRITAQNSNNKYEGEGGGAPEPSGTGPQVGLGPGGGHPLGGTGAGAGGASYCGVGGKGGNASGSSAMGGAGGAPYGTPEIVPLKGGSSGGKNGNHSGAGGGAIQLVADTSLEITSEGSINMGGRGGGWFGNGGGSGGSILLESPTITVAGALAANGGGGGGGSGSGGMDGADATADVIAATGGTSPTSGAGGAGSADVSANGVDGQSGSQAGGGGGGAGRIRINTASATASLTGRISPAFTTLCASQGTLTPKK